MSDASMEDAEGPALEVDGAAIDPEEIVCVRRGPGANCSSIGSAIDVLFATAAFAGAILVVVSAAMGEKKAAPAKKKEEAPDAGPS